MICFPNAKINLGLNIVSKRSDGYHNLETVFYPIGIKDALEIIVNPDLKEDTFNQLGINIGGEPENNLVMKALKLMRQHYKFPFVEVHLLKKIPFGAGIGGGSADAAFMLKLINNTFDFGITDEKMVSLATQLGADCPFFIFNRPMFATGIGEKLEDVSLSLDEYKIVLVKPDIHISTKEAFAGITPRHSQVSLKEIIQKPITEWKETMINDFEKGIVAKFPRVAVIKNILYEQGANYASMTGSGSSVYGIFKEIPSSLHSNFTADYYWEQTD